MGNDTPLIALKYVGHFALNQPADPPVYKTPGSAGVDLHAAIPNHTILLPGSRILIPTGIAVAISDPSLVGVVCSRSGIFNNFGVRVGQGVGIIDSDYREEIGVILQNDDTSNAFKIKPGMRIAQLLFMPVTQVKFEIVHDLDETERKGGFGHTGLEG